jgi:hypothetical protein
MNIRFEPVMNIFDHERVLRNENLDWQVRELVAVQPEALQLGQAAHLVGERGEAVSSEAKPPKLR